MTKIVLVPGTLFCAGHLFPPFQSAGDLKVDLVDRVSVGCLPHCNLAANGLLDRLGDVSIAQTPFD